MEDTGLNEKKTKKPSTPQAMTVGSRKIDVQPIAGSGKELAVITHRDRPVRTATARVIEISFGTFILGSIF